MKKLKFLGTAVLAASLLFAGCSSPEIDSGDSNPNPVVNPDPTPDPNPDPDPTSDPLKDYYKYYLVSTPKQDTNKGIADWGAGSTATPNDDGTYTISASAAMWGGISGICAPFTGFDAGTLANYEYIVFTLDTSDFEIDTTETGGNYGVNVKIPETQIEVSEYASSNTYRVPLSIFEAAPSTATEFAIIIGGSGTLKLNELYLAAREDPNNKAITGITITPTSISLEQGGTQQFTVKDSNFVNRTSEVTYTLSGDAAEGSAITEDGLLTVGTTAGTLTVTATYTVDDNEFKAESSITVLGTVTNLITSVGYNKVFLAPGWSAIVNTDDGTGNPEDYVSVAENNAVSYTLASGLAGQWQAQLRITTDADLAEGDEWYFSCKLNGVTGGYTIKLNDDEQLIVQQTGTIGENGTTVSFSGTVPAGLSFTDLPIMFDFGTCSEGTVVISDIVLTKTN